MKRKGSHRSVDEREESESSSHMVSKAAICWDPKTALDYIPQPMSGVARAIRVGPFDIAVHVLCAPL